MTMAARLNRGWRIVATGFSFVSFGVGGLFIGVLIWPLVAVLSGDMGARQQRMQRVVHYVFRLFVAQMCALGLIRVRVENREALLRPGQLVIANHPTLIDVVVLISLMPQTCCVVKDSLFRNPFTRGPIRGAGYIANSASAELVEQAAAVLRNGESLVIFPEGTRTTPGQRPRFQRGTANIALAAGVPLRPVFIHGTPSTLTKNQPWYDVPERRLEMHLRVAELIDPEQLVPPTAHRARAARILTRHLENALWEGALALATETAPTGANGNSAQASPKMTD